MKNNRKKVLAAVVTLACMGVCAVQAEGTADAQVVKKSYGPMISIEGTEKEQALKIHSAWNKTFSGNVIGTVVAWGTGNTIHVGGEDAVLGKNDGIKDETMKITFDLDQFDNKEYKGKDKKTGEFKGGRYRTGDISIEDAIVAKSEMGGTIHFTGKDMHYALLYAHKNQYGEKYLKEPAPSTITVTLSGDLIAGGDDAKLGAERGDWLSRVKTPVSGGSYKVGNINAGGSSSGQGGEGFITVQANNITANEVRTYEDSGISLLAKNALTVGEVHNDHDSQVILQGKTITAARVSYSMGGTETVLGNENTDSVTIQGRIVGSHYWGGEASRLTVMGKRVEIGDGVDFTNGDNVRTVSDVVKITGDEVVIHHSQEGRRSILQTDINVLGNKTLVVDGKGEYALRSQANVQMQAPEVNIQLGDITLQKISGGMDVIYGTDKELKAPKVAALVIAADAGAATLGAVKIKEMQGTVIMQGMDAVTLDSLTMDKSNTDGKAIIQADTITVHNKRKEEAPSTPSYVVGLPPWEQPSAPAAAAKPVDTSSITVEKNNTASVVGNTITFTHEAKNSGTLAIAGKTLQLPTVATKAEGHTNIQVTEGGTLTGTVKTEDKGESTLSLANEASWSVDTAGNTLTTLTLAKGSHVNVAPTETLTVDAVQGQGVIFTQAGRTVPAIQGKRIAPGVRVVVEPMLGKTLTDAVEKMPVLAIEPGGVMPAETAPIFVQDTLLGYTLPIDNEGFVGGTFKQSANHIHPVARQEVHKVGMLAQGFGRAMRLAATVDTQGQDVWGSVTHQAFNNGKENVMAVGMTKDVYGVTYTAGLTQVRGDLQSTDHCYVGGILGAKKTWGNDAYVAGKLLYGKYQASTKSAARIGSSWVKGVSLEIGKSYDVNGYTLTPYVGAFYAKGSTFTAAHDTALQARVQGLTSKAWTTGVRTEATLSGGVQLHADMGLRWGTTSAVKGVLTDGKDAVSFTNNERGHVGFVDVGVSKVSPAGHTWGVTFGTATGSGDHEKRKLGVQGTLVF